MCIFVNFTNNMNGSLLYQVKIDVTSVGMKHLNLFSYFSTTVIVALTPFESRLGSATKQSRSSATSSLVVSNSFISKRRKTYAIVRYISAYAMLRVELA